LGADLENGIFFRAATDLAPAPTVSPVPPPHLSPRPEAPRPFWRSPLFWTLALLVLAALTWTIRALRRQATQEAASESVRTAVVERRDFVRSVRVNGTVEAIQSYIVAAPTLTGQNASSLIITHLPRAGAVVKRGDLLVEFDRQAQIKNSLDKEAEYRDFEEQIKKKQADQAAARAKDDTELKQAEDAVRSAELEVSRNEVVSRIDAEKNLTNQEEARARFKQLQQTYELKRKAAQAELHELEIQRDRSKNDMQHAQRNSEKMTVRSPQDGVVVLNTIWKGGQMGEVQEGDEVRPGVPFMQVMNPDSMQVRSKINQTDIGLLRVGMPVQVHLDAYPAISLPGRLERLSVAGNPSNFSDKVRSFIAIFSIRGSDPKLIPDLTAAVDVELERAPGVLVVPRDAVVTGKSSSYVLVKDGSSASQREVKLGRANEVEYVIESGVDSGAVVLRNPETARGEN